MSSQIQWPANNYMFVYTFRAEEDLSVPSKSTDLRVNVEGQEILLNIDDRPLHSHKGYAMMDHLREMAVYHYDPHSRESFTAIEAKLEETIRKNAIRVLVADKRLQGKEDDRGPNGVSAEEGQALAERMRCQHFAEVCFTHNEQRDSFYTKIAGLRLKAFQNEEHAKNCAARRAERKAFAVKCLKNAAWFLCGVALALAAVVISKRFFPRLRVI